MCVRGHLYICIFFGEGVHTCVCVHVWVGGMDIHVCLSVYGCASASVCVLTCISIHVCYFMYVHI